MIGLKEVVRTLSKIETRSKDYFHFELVYNLEGKPGYVHPKVIKLLLEALADTNTHLLSRLAEEYPGQLKTVCFLVRQMSDHWVRYYPGHVRATPNLPFSIYKKAQECARLGIKFPHETYPGETVRLPYEKGFMQSLHNLLDKLDYISLRNAA